MQSIWHSVRVYGEFYLNQFGIVGTILTGVGGVWIWRKKKTLGVVLIGTWILAGVGIAIYMKFPGVENISDVGYYWGTVLRSRMLLSSYMIGGLLVILGIGLVWSWAQKRQKVMWMGIALLVWIVAGVKNGYPVMDWSRANFVNYYSQAILNSLPEAAVLVVDDDIVFSLLYLQLVEQKRPDVVIMPATTQMRYHWIRREMSEKIDFYHDRDEQTVGMIARFVNEGERVYIYGLETSTLERLGIEGNPFFLVPNQYTLEVVREKTLPWEDFNYGLTQQLVNLADEELTNWDRGWLGHVSVIHTILGYNQGRWGNTEAALIHLDIAQNLAQLENNKIQISALRQGLLSDTNNLMTVAQVSGPEWQALARQSFLNGDYENAWFQAERAVMLEPDSLLARELLIEILAVTNEISMEDHLTVYRKLSARESVL